MRSQRQPDTHADEARRAPVTLAVHTDRSGRSGPLFFNRELEGGIRLAKGAYWVLEVGDNGEIVGGTYHAAP